MSEIFLPAIDPNDSEWSSVHKNFVKYARKNKKFWFRIDDPYSRRNGTIGCVSMDRTSWAYVGTTNFASAVFQRYHNMFISKSRAVGLVLGAHDLTYLPDYTGSFVNKLAKTSPSVETTELDILGTEIKVGAFVAASNGKNMFVGNVLRFNAKRSDYGRRIVAEIKVIPTDERVKTPNTITISPKNLMVITDTIKTQALVAKLAM